MNKFIVQKYFEIEIVSYNEMQKSVFTKKTLQSSIYSNVLNGHQPIKPPIFKVHFCQFSQLLFILLSAPVTSTLSWWKPQ